VPLVDSAVVRCVADRAAGKDVEDSAAIDRVYVNDHAIEAEMYLSRRSEMDSIHKRQLSAQRRRDSSLRQLEQRRSRQQKEAKRTSGVR
jgi:hypothetical protein